MPVKRQQQRRQLLLAAMLVLSLSSPGRAFSASGARSSRAMPDGGLSPTSIKLPHAPNTSRMRSQRKRRSFPRQPSNMPIHDPYQYHSSCLRAAAAIDPLDDRDSRGSNRKRAWPRRVWSKILRKQDSRPHPNTNLRMRESLMDEETEELLDSILSYAQSDGDPSSTTESPQRMGPELKEEFILRNLEDLSPEIAMSEIISTTVPDSGRPLPPAIDSEFFDVSLAPPQEADNMEKAVDAPYGSKKKKPSEKATLISKWMGTLFENIVTGIIERNALEEPDNLSVRAIPRGNVMASLFQGKFHTNAEIDASGLIFPAIRMSSGRLEVKRLILQITGFIGNQNNGNGSGKPAPTRYPEQFDLHAHDWTFTQDDLMESRCIRNGLKNLLVRILQDKGVRSSSIEITSIDILSSGKVSCKGQAMTLFDNPIRFEVRSGISFSGRGHVLTFPGLEVALNGDLGLFVPVVPAIDLDVGHNARFERIDIDGDKQVLSLNASVTITPARTVRLNQYQQSNEAFAAMFSTDVGQWLTNLGNFRN